MKNMEHAPSMYYPGREELKEYFTFAVSIDNVIFGFDDGNLKVLLIKRGQDPYNGLWALPGDLVQVNEGLEAAASRILNDLTGLQDVYLEQVASFGAVDRHPIGRVVTVAYYSLLKIAVTSPSPQSWASHLVWHDVDTLDQLAFDHTDILQAALLRLQHRVRTQPIGFELLPEKFSLTEIQHLYEAILNTELDKRNFRKKLLSMNFIIDLEEYQEDVAHRPAKLFKFDQAKYDQLVADGLYFELKENRRRV